MFILQMGQLRPTNMAQLTTTRVSNPGSLIPNLLLGCFFSMAAAQLQVLKSSQPILGQVPFSLTCYSMVGTP